MEAEEFLSGGIFFSTLDYLYISPWSSSKVNPLTLIFSIFFIFFFDFNYQILFNQISGTMGKGIFESHFFKNQIFWLRAIWSRWAEGILLRVLLCTSSNFYSLRGHGRYFDFFLKSFLRRHSPTVPLWLEISMKSGGVSKDLEESGVRGRMKGWLLTGGLLGLLSSFWHGLDGGTVAIGVVRS